MKKKLNEISETWKMKVKKENKIEKSDIVKKAKNSFQETLE